jgi:hypothetical protein
VTVTLKRGEGGYVRLVECPFCGEDLGYRGRWPRPERHLRDFDEFEEAWQ